MSLGRLLMFFALTLTPFSMILGERRSGIWQWGTLFVCCIIFYVGWRLENRKG